MDAFLCLLSAVCCLVCRVWFVCSSACSQIILIARRSDIKKPRNPLRQLDKDQEGGGFLLLESHPGDLTADSYLFQLGMDSIVVDRYYTDRIDTHTQRTYQPEALTYPIGPSPSLSLSLSPLQIRPQCLVFCTTLYILRPSRLNKCHR